MISRGFYLIQLVCLICVSQLKSEVNTSCDSKTSCHECIAEPSCAWCFQNEFRDHPRCSQVQKLASVCQPQYMHYPSNMHRTLESLPLSAEVPMQPQRIRIQLRPHQPYPLIITYFKANGIKQSSVELKDNATHHIGIKYHSKCLAEEKQETNKCDLAEHGDNRIQFEIELELQECPKTPENWPKMIAVYPVGIAHSLLIEVEMLCSCPCELPESPGYKENAPECSGVGTLNCGVCDCGPLHWGRKCKCTLDPYLSQNTTLGCKPPGSTDPLECSGRGSCICNQCDCDTRDSVVETISGLYCECDNFSCSRHGGEICGGHGICDCGECKCDPPWTGKACECYNATNTCFSPFKKSPQLCDGHGDCVCGICQCQVTAEVRYTGCYCEQLILEQN